MSRISAAYTGHGLAFAFHCAKRLAEALTGFRPAIRLLPLYDAHVRALDAIGRWMMAPFVGFFRSH